MHTDIKTRLGNAQAFNRDFRIDETILNEFTAFAEAKGVKLDPDGLATSRRDILIYVKAFIGRRFFDDDAFYPTFHESDNVLRRAVELLPQAKELSKTGKFELK
jgi:hypothetical protein